MQDYKVLVAVLSIGLFCSAAPQAQMLDSSEDCANPRFLLHMSNAAGGITGAESLLLNGTPLRTYEGEPYEWSHYAIAPLPCEGDDLPSYKTGDDVVAGVFIGAEPRESDADQVPENCTGPIYLLGVNTVKDADQYAIYIEALSGSRIAPRHGFVRVFGRTPVPLLEGTWPDNTTATLSTWPCAEAFHKMHTSDQFQNDIKPLRNNAAHYRLMTFTPVNLP